jgi:hypothetical protein
MVQAPPAFVPTTGGGGQKTIRIRLNTVHCPHLQTYRWPIGDRSTESGSSDMV